MAKTGKRPIHALLRKAALIKRRAARIKKTKTGTAAGAQGSQRSPTARPRPAPERKRVGKVSKKTRRPPSQFGSPR